MLIEGRNGAGKTSLLRQLLPALPGAAVLPQTHEDLPRPSRCWTSSGPAPRCTSRRPSRSWRRSCSTTWTDRRPLGQLSPGQVRRLLIATMVNRPSRLLVLDEPTNHLDFDSLDVVEEALSGYRGALLVVSHDEELAARIGLTQRWLVAGGRLESAA